MPQDPDEWVVWKPTDGSRFGQALVWGMPIAIFILAVVLANIL